MQTSAVTRAISRIAASSAPDTVRDAPAGVTIAIPNWNHETVLPRSILSALRAADALREKGVGAEVLVIDDFSRDGSLTLLRQLEALHYDDGLRVLALARNCGLPVVRNLALERATYRYVVFMDADNELIPENVHDFYRSMTDTGAAVVYGNLLVRDRTGRDTRLMNNESFQHRMFEAGYIDAFAMVDKLQIADAGGYISQLEIQACEDWELYLHLACNGRKIIFVPVVFGVYHEMEHSMVKEITGGNSRLDVYVRRVFDQQGIRQSLPLATKHLRYHPDIGYV